MSALLQSAPKDPNTGQILSVAGTDAPEYFTNGLPYDAGLVAIDTAGVVDHYHQGLPFTEVGRLVVTQNAPLYFSTGAAPFADSKLCATEDEVTHWVNGVPYTAVSAVSMFGAIYFVYYFNGIDQFVTINTPWAPRGLPYTISGVTDSLEYTSVDIFTCSSSGILSSLANIIAANRSVGFYEDVDGVSGNGGNVDLLPPYRSHLLELAGDSALYSANGIPAQTPTLIQAKSLGMDPYEWMATQGNGPTTDFYEGVIKQVGYTDNSPIQGRDYAVGDGNQRGLLNSSIPMDMALPWTLEFDWVVIKDVVVNHYILSSTDPESVFDIFVNAATDPDALRLKVGDSTTNTTLEWTIALTNIANGQHVHVKLDSPAGGNNVILTIDNLEIPLAFGLAGALTGSIDGIGRNDTDAISQRMTGTLANLSIAQGSLSWLYPLERVDGNDFLIVNTDPSTFMQPLTNLQDFPQVQSNWWDTCEAVDGQYRNVNPTGTPQQEPNVSGGRAGMYQETGAVDVTITITEANSGFYNGGTTPADLAGAGTLHCVNPNAPEFVVANSKSSESIVPLPLRS
jgi:hypothetical protein